MDRNGCFCRLLPRPTRAFPGASAGRRPSLHFRGLLGLHSRRGLPDWPNDESFVATYLTLSGFTCRDFNDGDRSSYDAGTFSVSVSPEWP